MKHILTLTLILLTLSFSKELTVLETTLIHSSEQEAFYFPSYSSDGQNILFTKMGYQGLWSHNLSSAQSTLLTNSLGAGYHPVSLRDGTVLFRQDDYVNNLKYTSYMKVNTATRELVTFTSPGRFVSSPVMAGSKLLYMANDDLKVRSIQSGDLLSKSSTDVAIINDKLEIQLLHNGSLTTLSPRGEGDYIWAELSPDKTRILFTKIGDGTYICNLAGEILVDLGYAHASKWSPDGRLILYMRDYDDGVQFTGSDIWISSSQTGESWQVTNTSDKIEMYPRWSPDNTHITYHTLRGDIYQTKIQFVD